MQAEKIESLKDRFNQDQGRQEKKEGIFLPDQRVIFNPRIDEVKDEPDAGQEDVDRAD